VAVLVSEREGGGLTAAAKPKVLPVYMLP
jgi:hypothetical protein